MLLEPPTVDGRCIIIIFFREQARLVTFPCRRRSWLFVAHFFYSLCLSAFFFRVLQVSVALIPYMRAFGLLAASGSLTPPLNSVKGISSVLELSGWLAVYLFFNRLLLSLGLLSVVVSLGTFVVEAVTSIIESSAIFSHPLYICYNIHFANLIVWVSPSSLGCLD